MKANLRGEPFSHQMVNTEFRTRPLTADDLTRVIDIDAQSVGRRRDDFYRKRLEAALADPGKNIGLRRIDSIDLSFETCDCLSYIDDKAAMTAKADLLKRIACADFKTDRAAVESAHGHGYINPHTYRRCRDMRNVDVSAN